MYLKGLRRQYQFHLYLEEEVKAVVVVTVQAGSLGPWRFIVSLGYGVDGEESNRKRCPAWRSLGLALMSCSLGFLRRVNLESINPPHTIIVTTCPLCYYE